MEKDINNIFDFSKFPPELHQHIASYLNLSSLNFFAQSNKQIKENILSLLYKYQKLFKLHLETKEQSTYLWNSKSLFVCGNNHYGQLGLGEKKYHSPFAVLEWPADLGKIKKVVAGWGHTLLINSNNQLWACGNNQCGQLGLKNKKFIPFFTAVPWLEEQGKIKQVAAGVNHTILLTENNKLWACGDNQYGQLGLKNVKCTHIFTSVPWSENQGKIKQIISGRNYTLVLTECNRLWACGDNEYGQLGLSNKLSCFSFVPVPWIEEKTEIKQLAAGGEHTILLTDTNKLFVCGNNYSGQLGLNDKNHRHSFTLVPWPEKRGQIQKIIAGGYYTIALTESNELWVCGDNYSGQLGLKYKKKFSVFTAIVWPKDHGKIQKINAGSAHTILFTEERKLWASGYNLYGQLGLQGKNKYSAFTYVIKLEELIKLDRNSNQPIETQEENLTEESLNQKKECLIS